MARKAAARRPFPRNMPLGQFLFDYLHRNGVCVIDVRVPRDDMSPQLTTMSSELARLRNPKA
ncbi:MAG: hypothetical protein ABSB42_22425 [Tepidisphaeraceae bacterium]|jgi:hypothetical protein